MTTIDREAHEVNLRGTLDGETVLILGGGESILQHEPEELLRFTTVGMNQIAKRVVTHYCTLVDHPPALRRQAGLEAPLRSLRHSLCFTQQGRPKGHRETFEELWRPLVPADAAYPLHVFTWFKHWTLAWDHYRRSDYERLLRAWDAEHDRPPLPFAPASSGVATFLAMYLGAKRIGLLGVDYTGGHFWDPRAKFVKDPRTIAKNKPRWGRLAHVARTVFGCEVFNLSRRSVIDTVPFRALEDM